MNLHLTDPIEILPQCQLWLAFFDGESTDVTERDIADANFSSRDLLRWQQFRPDAKKRQFLNSRLAIRAVLRQEFGMQAVGITFDSDSSGCPLLLSRDRRHVAHISLSHSANAVAVVISDGEYPVGVDIEVPEPLRSKALQLVVLHPHEQAWFDHLPGLESEALTTLWTIKEAVWKTLRDIRDIPLSEISLTFNTGILQAAISSFSQNQTLFRTQVFVQNSVPVAPDTLCLSTANVPLRGCVAQRIAP